MAENILQYSYHRTLVDILKLFELRKVAYQIEVVHGFI
jgi:hypothetical protein